MASAPSSASGAAAGVKRPAAPSMLAKPLPTATGKVVSGSAFAFLFSEMVSYHRNRVTNINDLETRLDAAGYGVGLRFLELIFFRDRPAKRETTVVTMLQFISSTVWVHLFSKSADALEKSTDAANSYMIRDDEPLTNYWISMPKEMARLNCAAFIAGIVRGMLDGAGFPCTVSAITTPTDGPRDKTVFLIKFADSVASRSDA